MKKTMNTLGKSALGALAVITVIGSTFTSTVANAASAGGFILGASVMRNDLSTDGTVFGDSNVTETYADLKAGIEMSSGLYIGGIYNMKTNENSGSKTERSGYGATIGYHSDGWFLDGSYFLSSTVETAGGTKVEDGSGFGVDVGRNFDVSNNAFFGVQLSYKSLSYAKANGVEAKNNIKGELTPMLNVGVRF